MPAGLLFEATVANGWPAQKVANRVSTPFGMANAYTDMVSKIPGFSPPTLEFYDDLHGVGGLFLADQWVIAIGVRDMEEIADHVFATRWAEVVQIVAQLAREQGMVVRDVRQVMIGMGMERCISHELGHSLISCGWHNPFAPDQEAGADFYAGKLDAARGQSWRLGEMIFRAIGCTGPTCDHPTPDGRSQAYVAGYNEQSSSAA